MDKFSIYNDIEKRIQNCNEITKTAEGKLIVWLVCERIKDAMGMGKAARQGPRVSQIWNERKTHQQIAIEWFRDEEHFPLCDAIDVNPSWINSLLKTKAGVEL